MEYRPFLNPKEFRRERCADQGMVYCADSGKKRCPKTCGIYKNGQKSKPKEEGG